MTYTHAGIRILVISISIETQGQIFQTCCLQKKIYYICTKKLIQPAVNIIFSVKNNFKKVTMIIIRAKKHTCDLNLYLLCFYNIVESIWITTLPTYQTPQPNKQWKTCYGFLIATGLSWQPIIRLFVCISKIWKNKKKTVKCKYMYLIF